MKITFLFAAITTPLIFFSAESVLRGAEPKGLLIYTDPPATYVESCEFYSLDTTKHLYSTIVRTDGQSLQINTGGLWIVVNYPPLNPQENIQDLANANLDKIPDLIRQYPQFKAQLVTAQTKWQNALAFNRQAQKLVKSDLPTITLKYEGAVYEGVHLTSLDGEQVDITYSAGVISLALEQLSKEQIVALNTTSTSVHIDPDWNTGRIAQQNEPNSGQNARKIQIAAPQPPQNNQEESASSNPSAVDYCQLGAAKYDKHDWNAAIADFDRAVELDPRNAPIYVMRGLSKKAKGDVDGAIADYSHAIELNPKIASAYINRGKAKAGKGDLDGAIADFDSAIELDPKDAEAYVYRSIVKNLKGDVEGAVAGNGDHDAAIADAERVIELNPKYALNSFDRAIELDSKNAGAYFGRGMIKQIQGDHDGAIADFNHALELNPKDPDAYNGRGNAKQAKGDLDGAIADYNSAIELDPKFADAYNNRGLAKKAKGDLEGAIADHNRANELDPKNAEPEKATVPDNKTKEESAQNQQKPNAAANNEEPSVQPDLIESTARVMGIPPESFSTYVSIINKEYESVGMGGVIASNYIADASLQGSVAADIGTSSGDDSIAKLGDAVQSANANRFDLMRSRTMRKAQAVAALAANMTGGQMDGVQIKGYGSLGAFFKNGNFQKLIESGDTVALEKFVSAANMGGTEQGSLLRPGIVGQVAENLSPDDMNRAAQLVDFSRAGNFNGQSLRRDLVQNMITQGGIDKGFQDKLTTLMGLMDSFAEATDSKQVLKKLTDNPAFAGMSDEDKLKFATQFSNESSRLMNNERYLMKFGFASRADADVDFAMTGPSAKSMLDAKRKQVQPN